MEKRVYDLVDEFSEYLQVPNDRYRLSYNLLQKYKGNPDSMVVIVEKCKLTITGINEKELATKMEAKFKELN